MLSDKKITPDLPVQDLERARKFYEEKLGLKPVMSSDYDVMYVCGGGTNLYLYRREPTKVEHTEVSWNVDDIEAEMKDLRSRGVEFESYDLPELKTDENDIAVMDGVRASWFKDPEGNILSLVQM